MQHRSSQIYMDFLGSNGDGSFDGLGAADAWTHLTGVLHDSHILFFTPRIQGIGTVIFLFCVSVHTRGDTLIRRWRYPHQVFLGGYPIFPDGGGGTPSFQMGYPILPNRGYLILINVGVPPILPNGFTPTVGIGWGYPP